MFHIAMFGCAHLGYAPDGLRRTLDDGTNVIAADGYAAHRQIIHDIITTAESLGAEMPMIDGGDLFHSPSPTPAAVDAALTIDQARVSAGIERFGIPGNHDRRSARGVPAVAVLRNQPGSHLVAPRLFTGYTGEDTGAASLKNAGDDPRRDVRVPGLYEVWQLTTPGEGVQVFIHLVNEQALAPVYADMDTVDPRPVDGAVNFLVTHGIIPDPERTFVQADERGGNRVIPRDWFNRGFTAALLADFHTPDGGTLDTTPWIYVGSAVRRGFADAEAARGWALVSVADDGQWSIEFREVAQRRAIDTTVDLSGVTDPDAAVAAVERTLASLDGTVTDPDAGARTGDAGVRVRISVTQVAPEVDETLRLRVPEWNRRLPEALSLEVRINRGAAAASTVTNALANVPVVGDETITAALTRLAGAGVIAALTNLDDATRVEALDMATAALD